MNITIGKTDPLEYAERLYAPVRRATLDGPPAGGLHVERRERAAALR